MLTAKQNELLSFIDHRLTTTGVSPSFREMMIAVELNSTAGVHRLVRGLCERGHLRRIPNRARAMEVLKRASGPDWTERRGGSATPSSAPARASASSVAHLRVMDGIASGSPLWLDGPDGTMPVPAVLVGAGQHFVLRMRDDSMVGEGILPGDAVLIRRSREGVDGRMALVQCSGRGHAIRRWSREGSMIRLDPANRSRDPERFDAAAVAVHGIVAGVIRTYA